MSRLRTLASYVPELAAGFAVGAGVGVLVELARYSAERIAGALAFESAVMAELEYQLSQPPPAPWCFYTEPALTIAGEPIPIEGPVEITWRDVSELYERIRHAHQLERESSAAAAAAIGRADELYERLCSAVACNRELGRQSEERGELVRELTAELVRLREVVALPETPVGPAFPAEEPVTPDH